jgi:hypothetical protein
MRGLAVAALALLLAGCGTVTDLKPKPGKNLPAAPYGRVYRPGAGELLGQSAQVRPGRAVELHTRSEQRADDPYDLPPKD